MKEKISQMDDNTPSTEERIGRKLRLLRLNRGLSLKALSEHSSLNVNTLCLIENGKTSPSVSTLQQLSMAMDIPITYFFESEPVLKRIVFTRLPIGHRLRLETH